MCRRGDIYYINFGEDGRKQRGIRPAVIVSNDKANQYSPIITVVPVTSKIHKKKFLPTHVIVDEYEGTGLNRPSVILAEQVVAVDKINVLGKIGEIGPEVMAKVTWALGIQIGINK